MEKTNPRVFLDITIENNNVGRIVIELYADQVPRTAENFRVLCRGDKGGKYTYKGCVFHRIIPHFIIQSGDFNGNDGSQNESIYGPKFDDENFNVHHDSPGIVSMANSGRNTNGGQFFITLVRAPWLDNSHVAFGKVIEGFDIVKLIQEAGQCNGVPKQKVVISDCGEI